MSKHQKKQADGDVAAVPPTPTRFARPQPTAPEVIAVIAALLETELRLHVGGRADAWTFPVAAAGHGWSESGRQLVAAYERGMKP